MKDLRQIETFLRSAPIKSNDHVSRFVLQDLLDHWDQPPIRTSVKHDFRRKIMFSKTGRISAAVFVVFIVITGVLNLGQKNHGFVLGDITDSMDTMPWIHVKGTIQHGEVVENVQEWENTDQNIFIVIDPDGSIRYTNHHLKTAYAYCPVENTITISSAVERFDKIATQSASDQITSMIDTFESQDANTSRKTITQNGKHVEVFHLLDEHQDMMLTVDVQKKLPVSMRIIFTLDNEEYTASVEFDYPRQGPADIYDLGAPADARIIDNRSETNANNLIKEVQKRFDEGFEDHIAVVLGSQVFDNERWPMELIVLRKKGDMKRLDNYNVFNDRSDQNPVSTLYALIKDQWPILNIQNIMDLEGNQYGQSQAIYDGMITTQRLNYNGQNETMSIPGDISKSLPFGSMSGFSWCHLRSLLINRPNEQAKCVLLPKDPSHTSWQGLEITRHMQDPNKPLPQTNISRITTSCWFDSSKDYLLMKRHIVKISKQGNRISTTRILETAQTSEGNWYPKVIQTKSSYLNDGKMIHPTNEKRILLDTDHDFKDGVFDRASLKVVN